MLTDPIEKKLLGAMDDLVLLKEFLTVTPDASWMQLLGLAAEAFVQEAEQRRDAGEPLLHLSWADVFRGLVIETGIRRHPEIDPKRLEKTFRLFADQASTVEQRNHHNAANRALGRLEDVRAKWLTLKRQTPRASQPRPIMVGDGAAPPGDEVPPVLQHAGDLAGHIAGYPTVRGAE